MLARAILLHLQEVLLRMAPNLRGLGGARVSEMARQVLTMLGQAPKATPESARLHNRLGLYVRLYLFPVPVKPARPRAVSTGSQTSVLAWQPVRT